MGAPYPISGKPEAEPSQGRAGRTLWAGSPALRLGFPGPPPAGPPCRLCLYQAPKSDEPSIPSPPPLPRKSLGFQIKSLGRGNIPLENPTNRGMEAPLPFSLGIVLRFLSRLPAHAGAHTEKPLTLEASVGAQPNHHQCRGTSALVLGLAPLGAPSRLPTAPQSSAGGRAARTPSSTNAGTHAHTELPESLKPIGEHVAQPPTARVGKRRGTCFRGLTCVPGRGSRPFSGCGISLYFPNKRLPLRAWSWGPLPKRRPAPAPALLQFIPPNKMGVEGNSQPRDGRQVVHRFSHRRGPSALR